MELNKVNGLSEKQATPLSQLFWGINLKNVSLEIGETKEFTFESASWPVISQFMKKNKLKILCENEIDSNFLNSEEDKFKANYYKNFCDLFVFKKENEVIGVYIAHPLNWYSYYFRYINVLPKYRGNALCEQAMDFFAKTLKGLGPSQIVSHVANSNQYQIARLLKHNFNITGNILSERWGAMVELTKYLEKKPLKKYLDNFCLGPRPGASDINH